MIHLQPIPSWICAISTAKHRRLESAVAAIQQRYGVRALRVARDLPKVSLPAALSTGFPELDALTGCRGMPLRATTLLTGPATSGKLTVAYKTLAAAQRDGLLCVLYHRASPSRVISWPEGCRGWGARSLF